MSLKMVLLLSGLGTLAGVALGYYLRLIISLGKKGSMELEIKQLMLEAREDAKRVVTEAEKRAETSLKEARVEVKEHEEKMKKTEDRLIKKEELLDKRQVDIDKEVEEVKTRVVEIKKIKEKVDLMEAQKISEVEKIAQLSRDDARAEIIKVVEKQSEGDLLVRMQKLEQFGEEKLEARAKEILTASIQRLGNAVSADVLTTTVTIPSDEIKGKIIGKEGRNIKAFERITGVELIVDDTPGAITI